MKRRIWKKAVGIELDIVAYCCKWTWRTIITINTLNELSSRKDREKGQCRSLTVTVVLSTSDNERTFTTTLIRINQWIVRFEWVSFNLPMNAASQQFQCGLSTREKQQEKKTETLWQRLFLVSAHNPVSICWRMSSITSTRRYN